MTPTTHHLADRTVIVTGAGSGIGRATAIAFAQAGARVLGVGRREANLRDTANTHPAITAFAADICADGAPAAVIDEAIGRWGRIDVLVNNAGATAVIPLAEITGARIAELFALNVTAPSLLARAALPYLREVHGSIVNLSSTFGHRPLPGGSHYAASKSAIEMLTQSWALELAEENVRVNAVAPGPTESEALAASGLPGEVVDKIKQDETARIPLGGVANPRTSRPGSSTSRTLPPLGSRDRSSPSTVAFNSPDRQRVRKVRVAMRHADPIRVGLVRLLADGHSKEEKLMTRSTPRPPGYVAGTWTIDSTGGCSERWLGAGRDRWTGRSVEPTPCRAPLA